MLIQIFAQPYGHHWGTIIPPCQRDRSNDFSRTSPKDNGKSYGNNQVLNRNYYLQSEIELVIKEMAEQVAARIRREGCQTQCIHLYIGTAFGDTEGLCPPNENPATDNTKLLIAHALFLFRKYYTGQVVRHVGITYSRLVLPKAFSSICSKIRKNN